MSASAIFGLILSGGKSARMGQNKGLISFHERPQREHLHAMLSPICQQTFLSCKSSDAIPAHLNPLPDLYSLSSPLNGILSAFTHTSSVAWLTVPVDMPMIDEKLIHHLINARDPRKLATCFIDSDGEKPEPLFALWEPAAFPALLKFRDAGEFSPRKFLIAHEAHVIPSPTRDLYLNINTPEDLAAYLSGKRRTG